MNRLEKRGDIYPRGVLQVCLDVHGRHTGSSEPDDQAQFKDITLLNKVLETWEPSTLAFDTAVCNLVVATLDEAESSWKPAGIIYKGIIPPGRGHMHA